MTAAPSQSAPPKSGFVTGVAAVFMAFSGFGTFIALMQNVMIAFMPKALFSEALQDPAFAHVMPAGARFIFEHMQLVVGVILVMCLAMLLSSIGLLRRRNWARLVFMALLAFGIIYNLSALVLQQSMIASFATQFPADSAFAPAGPRFQDMFRTMRETMLVFTIGFAGLFAWIIFKLQSAPIRAEFTGEGAV